MAYPEVEARIRGIRTDRTHGASWLSRAAVETLRLQAERSKASSACELLEELKEVGRELVQARPSMAPLANGVCQVVQDILRSGEEDVASLRLFTARRAGEWIEESEGALAKAAEHASHLISRGAVVMTHSYSSTGITALRMCRDKGIRVVATESRPLFEGRRTARELAASGLGVTLIVDSAMGYLMRNVDVALVGADSILADGSVVNKVGTYLMALAARENGVPLYAVCETSKFSVASLTGQGARLEEGEPGEVAEGLEGVEARNIYFEVTPSRLVNRVVTERGALSPEGVMGYVREMRKYFEWLYQSGV